MTLAVQALGTQLQLDDGAGNYTAIAEPKDINGFGFTRNMLDASNQQSSGGFEEILGSKLKRWREYSVECNFIPGHPTHDISTGLLAMINNGTRRNYRLVLMSNPVKTAQVLQEVVGFDMRNPFDGLLGVVWTFKPTGNWSFT